MKRVIRECLCLLLFGVVSTSVCGCQNAEIETIIRESLYEKEEIQFEPVTIRETDLEQKYYYQQLEEGDKLIYMEILQGIENSSAQINVHSSDAQRTNQLLQAVLYDHPDIFWCDGTSSATAYEGEQEYTVIEPEYQYSVPEKEEMQKVIESTAADWLSQISYDATDYDKILYVYETIVNMVEYDQNAVDNQNIYSVFGNKKSVCAGYSKATQYLLEQLGVFCTYVTGNTITGQSHAWNLVKCDGEYYYVDTTWGDPVFQSDEGEVAISQYISYDYMCCSSSELSRTHVPDPALELPECTKMDANYYVKNGMYYTEYNRTEILNKMQSIISAGENPVILKFSEESIYEEAHDDVLENVVKTAAQELAEQYGLSEVQYQYIDEKELNKITIYWNYE